MKADRRAKQYTVGALGFEVGAVVIGLVNNLSRSFSASLIDVSRLAASIGLILVGAAVESLRRLNSTTTGPGEHS